MRSSGAGATALKWTLVHIDTPKFSKHLFRADSGIATPGTLMFQRATVRYPALPRNEDGIYMRSIREEVGLKVLGRNYSHLFVRCFHGTNTWDEPHFLRKLYRRPSDWPQYMVNKLCRRDIFHHRSFQLNQAEQGTVEDMLNYHMGEAPNDLRKKVVA